MWKLAWWTCHLFLLAAKLIWRLILGFMATLGGFISSLHIQWFVRLRIRQTQFYSLCRNAFSDLSKPRSTPVRPADTTWAKTTKWRWTNLSKPSLLSSSPDTAVAGVDADTVGTGMRHDRISWTKHGFRFLIYLTNASGCRIDGNTSTLIEHRYLIWPCFVICLYLATWLLYVVVISSELRLRIYE